MSATSQQTGGQARLGTETVEKVPFGTLAAANEWRDDHPDALADADTRREKTVRLRPDVDDETALQAGTAAEMSRADEHKTYGQEPLTDRERRRLSRSYDRWHWQDHGTEAMAAKAALKAEGAADWLNYYEPGEGQAGALANLEAEKGMQARTGAGNARTGHRVDSDPDPGARGAELVEKLGAREQYVRETVRDHIDRWGAGTIRSVLDGEGEGAPAECRETVRQLAASESAQLYYDEIDARETTDPPAGEVSDPSETGADSDPTPRRIRARRRAGPTPPTLARAAPRPRRRQAPTATRRGWPGLWGVPSAGGPRGACGRWHRSW